jgi:hypothetical protein
VDTWPPVLDQVGSPDHPAAGRATARPVVPTQSKQSKHSPQLAAEDLPSAGSPPGGGSGPVYTG